MNEDWQNELVTKGAAFDAQEAYMANHQLDGYEDGLAMLDILRNLPPAQPEKVCIAEIKVDGDELQECVNRAMDKVVQQQEQRKAAEQMGGR